MFRRLILTAALATCMAVPAWAQTRATYVLSNGEKHNGVIVYGRGDNNIVDDKFHVNQSGTELVFEQPDVVVIDFVGDTPTAQERQALPADTGLMVMRDGSVMRGHIHNILKPDLVQWVNDAGQRNNYPIAEVKRLYLNTAIAQTVFLSTSPSPVATAGAPTRGIFGSSVNVRVEGNQQWVDTGVDVRRGDRVLFNSTGQVRFIGDQPAVTPAGSRGTNVIYPVPSAGGGSLIGRISNNVPFAVGGGNNRQIIMPDDGRLFLGINDDNVTDNSGAFSVTIRK